MQPAFLLRVAIAIGYIVLGVLLLTMPLTIKILNNITQPLFAALLLAYGGFRIYRAVQMLKEENGKK